MLEIRHVFVSVFLSQFLNPTHVDILYLVYLFIMHTTVIFSDDTFYLGLIQFLHHSDSLLVYMTSCLGVSWPADLCTFVFSRGHAGDISQGYDT